MDPRGRTPGPCRHSSFRNARSFLCLHVVTSGHCYIELIASKPSLHMLRSPHFLFRAHAIRAADVSLCETTRGDSLRVLVSNATFRLNIASQSNKSEPENDLRLAIAAQTIHLDRDSSSAFARCRDSDTIDRQPPVHPTRSRFFLDNFIRKGASHHVSCCG